MPRDGSRAPAAITTPVPVATRSPSPEGRSALAAGHELVLVARMADAELWDAILFVDNGAVRTLALPDTVDRAVLPVTDGERVYAYARSGMGQPASLKLPTSPPGLRGTGRGTNGARGRGARLVAFTLDGVEDETITDSTPLVEPRGLFASPNGAYLAFFLDNRQTRGTELWTYDTTARAKRVSVERLRRGEVTGPAFSADGSFLLRAGRQLIRGSPRRARADVLPITPSEDTRWEAGLVESPDGARVAVVAEVGDAQTAVERVLEYRPPAASPTVRFSAAGRLRLLAWLESGTLLVESRDGLWALRGETKNLLAGVPVGAGPVVAGDGGSVATLSAESGALRISVVGVPAGTRRVLSVLVPSPSPAPAASPPAGAVAEPSRFVLVQFVRMGARQEGRGQSLPAPTQPESVLQLVSERIRDIAEAPPQEPVTPERVWFTATHGAVYVDYRVGTLLWRRLLLVQAPKEAPATFTIRGVFAPLEGSWVLARGADLEESAAVALYEFEPDFGQWVEKPLVQGAAPE